MLTDGKNRISISLGKKECEVKPHAKRMQGKGTTQNTNKIDQQTFKSAVSVRFLFEMIVNEVNRYGNYKKIH